MAKKNCRLCDYPMDETTRFCPECGADSHAKRFSRETDLIAENERLKSELAAEKAKQQKADDATTDDI